jgi:hypothetical protein
MKYLTTWAAFPGAMSECVEKFLAGEAKSEPGITVLGRWHKVDLSGGVTISETDNAAAIYAGAAKWADVMEISICPVLEDAEIAPILAAQFKK